MKSIIDGEIAKNGATSPDDDSTEWVRNAINIMDDTISCALEKGGAPMKISDITLQMSNKKCTSYVGIAFHDICHYTLTFTLNNIAQE